MFSIPQSSNVTEFVSFLPKHCLFEKRHSFGICNLIYHLSLSPSSTVNQSFLTDLCHILIWRISYLTNSRSKDDRETDTRKGMFGDRASETPVWDCSLSINPLCFRCLECKQLSWVFNNDLKLYCNLFFVF